MRKKTTVLLALLLSAATLMGCARQKTTQTTEALPTLIIGSDTYPPFTYLDENGDPTGIDVEIGEEAFRRMGYQADFQIINWAEKNQLLEDQKIDCIWGCFSMNGREDQYRWAGPYMVSRQVIAVNEDSDIESVKDLGGRTIAVQTTTKPEELLLNHVDPEIPPLGDVVSVENRSLQYAALDCGYVDALAAHETAILQYMKDYDAHFRILPEPLLTTGLGVAFRLDDSRGLDQELNRTLKEMREAGTMEEIIGRYLDNPKSYLEVDGLEG